jgi:hypothetical protein
MIVLLVSVIWLIHNSVLAIRYEGFPSLIEAKKYFKELDRLKRASFKAKEKQRLEKVNQEYQQKLAKLEEEKKKYL